MKPPFDRQTMMRENTRCVKRDARRNPLFQYEPLTWCEVLKITKIPVLCKQFLHIQKSGFPTTFARNHADFEENREHI
jgi:hypothetical protein